MFCSSALFARFLLPLGSCALFVDELFRFAPAGGLSLTYFRLLSAATTILFAGAAALAWRRQFCAGWLQFAFFFFSGFLLLTNSHHPTAPNFNALLCLGLEVPHYFLGEAALVVVFVLGAAAGWKFFGNAALWVADAAAVILIAFALVDFRLSQLLGVRLGWDVLALGNSPKMMWRMAAPYLPLLTFGVFLLSGVYSLSVRWVAARLRHSREGVALNDSRAWSFSVLR